MLRIKPELNADAQAYAERIGISLNALVSVALRDYLDQRKGLSQSAPAQPETAPRVHNPAPASIPREMRKPIPSVRSLPLTTPPAAGVYSLCPCGSGKKWRFCHGPSAN